ncbi:hypothetical protein [Mycolicibacterium tusciae]|uniref:hypothetical protein n=1 Tax=Mycolicibacterium tusciae TaxID=75922 RepID=UPI00024A3F17|nr:hypothetical protein [Mycolicibacterium tusciae]
MIQAIHASHNGRLYKVELQGTGDIADLVREHRLETVTAQLITTVFWFTPATHSSHTQLNRRATELLLATTTFTARQVPLLRGNVVITGINANGHPARLTDPQLHYLAGVEPNARDLWILSRRYTRDHRAQRRAARATQDHHMDAITRPWT